MSGLASFSHWRVMNQPCALASSMVLLIIPTARSAAGVTITLAPRNLISLRRSTLNGSAMVTTSGYPLAAHTMARPIPVFPLVASMTVWPGLSSPDLSAASITPRAKRSFTEPSGLKASIFTKRFTPCGAKRLIRTTGVLPIVSTILWYLRPMLPSEHCVVCDEKHCAPAAMPWNASKLARILLFRQGDAGWNCGAYRLVLDLYRRATAYALIELDRFHRSSGHLCPASAWNGGWRLW